MSLVKLGGVVMTLPGLAVIWALTRLAWEAGMASAGSGCSSPVPGWEAWWAACTCIRRRSSHSGS